jgi:hypothetical protein
MYIEMYTNSLVLRAHVRTLHEENVNVNVFVEM